MTAAAAALGIEVELVQRPAADSLEGAAALLGLEPTSIVKSLVVARSDGTFLFALVPGDRQIAWAKLRAAVGVNKLRLPSAEEALGATGYERGTITPARQHAPRGRCSRTSASRAVSRSAPARTGSARSSTRRRC